MVRYYGRAKTRVGSVNTNQLGLKMSGCPSKIGKSGYLVRYQSRRAQCNLKFFGPVPYHGIVWSHNKGKNTVLRQSKCAATAGGVGRINAPRFSCSKYDRIVNHRDAPVEKVHPSLKKKKLFIPLGMPIPINFMATNCDKVCLNNNYIGACTKSDIPCSNYRIEYTSDPSCCCWICV